MKKRAYRLSIDNINKAVHLIDPVFLNTPQFISDSLSKLFNLNLITKVETLNPIRCFKGRGSDLIAKKQAPGSHLVCASAGNFGQALAYSCKNKMVHLTVYASKNANSFKLQRMKELGAEVIQFGDDFDSAKTEQGKEPLETNAKFIEDGLEIESLEGAATIGLELLQYPAKIDSFLIALGNGALFNGVARVIKHYHPQAEVVAIQARGASAMIDSWRSSKLVSYQTTETIADGIAVRLPIPQALEDMVGLVDRALLVDDQSIIKGMQLIHQHLGIVSEPSGAVGLAAILENPSLFESKTVATIICGGNLTAEQAKALALLNIQQTISMLNATRIIILNIVTSIHTYSYYFPYN